MKSWWVQAQGLISALRMHRHTGKDRYYAFFESTLHWILEKQADWTNGDWHHWIRDGRTLEMSESGAWKSPYHNGRAVLECLEVLEDDSRRWTGARAPFLSAGSTAAARRERWSLRTGECRRRLSRAGPRTRSR